VRKIYLGGCKCVAGINLFHLIESRGQT
jgi:hypothetical protein